MKILYALHPKSLPSKWHRSGDTNMATRMIKHLPEDIEVHVFSDLSEYNHDNVDEMFEIFDRYRIEGSINSAPYIQKRTYLKESMKYLRSIADQYDIIHFHNSNVASIHWMTEFFADCKTPIIYTMHTPPENSSFQFFHRDEYLAFGKNPMGRLVAVSKSHYDRVLAALQVPAEDMPSLMSIVNGIEYTPFDEPVRDIDVIVVGRLDPTKDILHSLKSAVKCAPGGKVVYVGNTTETSVADDSYRKEVVKFIEESGIEWIKGATNPHVQRLMARSKAHIALSRIETYGLTVVEAQMQGTPVIGFNAGGIGENIVEGVTGSYVEAKGNWVKRYDRIAEQFQEVIGYDRDYIRQRASHEFNIQRTAKEYEALYRELGGLKNGI